MKRGVMGGTFDPIHYGHLVVAEAVRADFDLDQVVFVPAGVPPHKAGRSITSSFHRYLMTVLATASNPFFAVSRVELERPGPSYTIDTLRHLKRVWGREVEITFITGTDAIVEILQWKDPEELLETASFIAASRPGYPHDELQRFLDQLPPPLRGRIVHLEVPALAISSSDLRARVRSGRPIKYLLPESVERYIYKEGLYRTEGGA